MFTPQNLVNKYNTPGPRYTSYPTVPYWDNNTFSTENWIKSLVKAQSAFDINKGISLYIHLPFCESLCTFCGCNKRITKNHNVEKPYIDALIKEWNKYCSILKKPIIVKEIHLGGGTPTFFSEKNIEFLISNILKDTNTCENPEYSFEAHPNSTNKTYLEKLKQLKFNRVSFGVQDFNNGIQKAINRIQPFEQVKKVTEIARQVGFESIGHDIIFGLPFQTTDDVINTIEKTKLLAPDRLAFYSYAHVPWIKGNGQRGFKDSDLPTPKEKRTQYETGKAKLLDAGYIEIGMDHFALPHDALYQATKNKTLHRNFMGYTTSKTDIMIGLGVSSISDSWYGFAQNHKKLEDYLESINKNQYPVFRGHILTDEDTIIRKHILNIMTNLKTSWKNDKDKFIGINDVKGKLHEMIVDNLIKINDDTLIVKEIGRPFVRNVCMAFDKRLQQKEPTKKLFSMTI